MKPRRLLTAGLLATALAAPSYAITQHVTLLVDSDNDTATGCTVATPEGPFDGVELQLVTTVQTMGGGSGFVDQVERADCVDPNTDTFGALTLVDGGDWPVGIGLGVSGADVVETYFPQAVLPPDAKVLHLGVVIDDGVSPVDALLESSPGSGLPIILDLRALIEVPTLGVWVLGGFALLLALLALRAARSGGAGAVVALLLVCALAVSTTALWAAGTLDGLIDEWNASQQLATDNQGDGTPDLVALFGALFGNNLCFRIDAFLLFNNPPVATDDAASTDEDSVLNLPAPGVLANDTDPDLDPLTVTAFDATSAQGATVMVAANGMVNYDPTSAPALQALAGGTMVADTFDYTVSDPSGGFDVGTVTVTVSGVNDAPVAVADTFAPTEDMPFNVVAPGVLVNDSDVDTGTTLSAVLDTMPANASTFSLNADGSFDYTPALNFSGADSFTYHANDGTASSNVVAVTLNVGPVNDGPTAVDDGFMTAANVVLNVVAPGVLMNDTDPEGDPLSVVSFDDTSTQGTVTVNADGSFDYDPTGVAAFAALGAGASAMDTFTYTIQDPSLAMDTATVTVTVNGVNDPPTAVDDSLMVGEDDGPANITATVLANDTDPDAGDTLTVVSVNTTGTTGLVTLVAGVLSYSPNGQFESLSNGETAMDTFTYTIQDTGGSMSTATVTVTVNGVNDAPMVVGETFNSVIGNTSLQFAGTDSLTVPHTFTMGNVLANDSDVEMDTLSITAFQSPSTNGGVVSFNMATGEFVYEPPVGYEGADSFTYTVSDGTASTMGTVNLTVANVVWYIDSANDGAGDDGRSGRAFDDLAQFDAVQGVMPNGAEAGDIIFIHQGTGTYDAMAGDTDGLALLDQQKLLGEGVDLVVGATTLVTGNTANRPLIDNTNMSGDAITVDATAGNRTMVEIHGLDISSTRHLINVTSGGANQVGVLIADNAFGSASMEGIDLNPLGSGAFGATVENNVFSSASVAGNAIDVTTAGGTTGDVVVAINGNTDITSSAGDAIHLDNSAGGGNLYVSGFANNSVHGNTAGNGVFARAVTFDATPGGNFDQVAAGTWTIGALANRVGAGGMTLGAPGNEVSGDLQFTTLTLFAGNGAALQASGSGPLMAMVPSGFGLSVTGGEADAIAGPAVDLDPLTAAITLGRIASSSSPTNGVRLVGVGGSFSAGAMSSITGATGDSFLIDGGTVASTYQGGITHTSGASAAVHVQGGHAGGNVVFATGTISATNGTGLQFNNADSDYDFNGTTTLNGGDAGVDIENGSGGTFDFAAATSITHGGAGPAFRIASSAATVDDNGTIADSNGFAVDIQTLASGGSARFDGQVTASGAGLRIGGAAGSVDFANADLTGAATVDIDSNTAAITFADLDLNQTAGAVNAFDVNLGSANVTVTLTGNGLDSSTANRLVNVTGRAGGAVSFSGAVTLQGTGGNTGINVSGATAANSVSFNAAVDLGTGVGSRITGGGVSMIGNAANTVVSFNSLDIFTSAVPGIVATGNGVLDTATLAGTVNINTTGNGAPALDLDGIVSNTIIDSAVCSTNSNCVDLTNLGAISNTRLAGVGLTCSGGTCFNANAARTVVVTGATNTIGATNAAAVAIVDTTIGASGVTLMSASSSGATTGIRLDNAGTTGFFTVTGTGSTDGSGGTIQNTTQNGVFVRTTNHINLANMNFVSASSDGGGAGSCDATVFTGCNAAVEFETVTDVNLVNLTVTGAEDHGIFGQTVTDLDISNTNITGLGADVDTNEHGIFIRNLLGTVAGTTDSVFDNVTVDDAQDTAILVQNTTATNPGNTLSPDQLSVTNSVLTDAGDSGLNVQTIAPGANLRLVATGNLVMNTVDGIDAEASAGNLQASVGGAGVLTNTIGPGVGGDMVNGILFFASAANADATVDATATNNSVTLDAVKVGMPPVAPVSGLNGIGVSAGGASVTHLGTIRATVQGNLITSSFSGVLTQTVTGVITTNEGTGTTSQNVIAIDGNTITLNPAAGTTTAETVGIGVDGGTTGAGTTVRSTNNTILATGDASNGASVGIQILPTELGDPSGTGTRVCARVTDNDVSTPNNPFAATFLTTELDVIAAPVVTGSFLDVEAITVGPRTTAQLKAELEPLNTNTEVGDPGAAVAGTITGVMACPN